MSAPEIVANTIATALGGFPLQSTNHGIDLLLIAFMGLVVPAVSMRVKPLAAFILGVTLAAVYLVGAQVSFDHDTIIPVVYPLMAMLIAAVGTLAVHYSIGAIEQLRLHDTFSRFVPGAVVDKALKQTGDDLRLGGVRRVSTVMFSDLRGFTSLAESLEPEQVIAVLNKYLTEMSEAIMDRGGTLVAYMGDGIMAVFGAPLVQPNHADRALGAAEEMIGPRLELFNEFLKQEGITKKDVHMGVGLNSGEVMSGNVGSPNRIEYTAVGDTTNTAARLEGMTKDSGHSLFIADSTKKLLSKVHQDRVEKVDEMPVRGRKKKIVVWAIPDEMPDDD
jgi:adenylate cyclase